jgi:hypothetical protein
MFLDIVQHYHGSIIYTLLGEDGIVLLQKNRFSISKLDVEEVTVCMLILQIDTLPTNHKKIGYKQGSQAFPKLSCLNLDTAQHETSVGKLKRNGNSGNNQPLYSG